MFDLTSYGDWQTLSIAAAALALLASSVLIMASRLFGLKNLEQVAKTEFVYATSTIVIVMLVIFIIPYLEGELAGSGSSLARCLFLTSIGLSCDPTTSDSTTSGYIFYCDEAQTTPCSTLIDWMKLYMATPVKCVSKFMHYLYILTIPVDGMASIYMEIFMSEHASGFGVKWMSERGMNATQSLAFYMYIFYLLVHIFNFIKYYAGFFFSIGVVLRSFPPTRGTGAYMMALSVGLYFVFPLIYILIASTAGPHIQSTIASFQVDNAGGYEYFCAVPDVSDISIMGCGAADRPMWMVEQVKANAGELSSMLTIHVDSFVRHMTFAICLFPMIAFVALLTFVLNTTNLFGGNIPEIGRGLVKLI